MNIIKTVWFNEYGSSKPIGIVIGIGAIGERKAYIGVGFGSDEKADAKHIAENGAKVSKDMLEEVLKELK